MKNIDYLECFFKKHSLSGKIKVRYTSREAIDDYMSEIEFEDGVILDLNDIVFDIESDLPNDVYDQWMEARKEKDISLPEWIQTNTHYIPNSLKDRTSVENYQREIETAFESAIENYQREIETAFESAKDVINSIFHTIEDEGDSDSEDE